MDEADVARFEAGIAPQRLHNLCLRDYRSLEVNEANDSSYVEIEIAEGNSIRSSAWLLPGKEVVDLERFHGTL